MPSSHYPYLDMLNSFRPSAACRPSRRAELETEARASKVHEADQNPASRTGRIQTRGANLGSIVPRMSLSPQRWALRTRNGKGTRASPQHCGVASDCPSSAGGFPASEAVRARWLWLD
ncbi:hypothetical protein EVG20_g856 [Dentipellis fragilis]|uniref:Uncharacterized protein n=1 Tax=Dentipellis fragilis TaxID=205917 RepID=A0A4Y9ZEA6_9AGAM|nr:hypothetical protein EVG20_g856 [Dentipellis fragilis]